MTCIKTGAYVRFDEYGGFAPADLFQVGDSIIIQWMPAGWSYEALLTPTHSVTIASNGYHHKDRGVTVVPYQQCEEIL